MHSDTHSAGIHAHHVTWWAAWALVCVGCGESGLAPASGTVRLDGVVLTGGTLQVTPVGGGRGAIGDIQPDGHFTLFTRKPGDGAAPGKYTVTVVPSSEIPITSKLAAKLPKGAADSKVVFFGPADQPIEIAADRENEIEIDISVANGWRAVRDD